MPQNIDTGGMGRGNSTSAAPAGGVGTPPNYQSAPGNSAKQLRLGL